MTQEEKAKAYDEALEKAKKLYEKGTITESIGYIFPELAESEDEKIRKSIIENLKGNMYRADGDYDLLNKQISWLEKQGEKPQGKSALEAIKEKPANNANKVEPKFKVKYAGIEYVRKDALVKKACEWLYKRQAVDLEVSDIEKFVNEFKKAMEGGEE